MTQSRLRAAPPPIRARPFDTKIRWLMGWARDTRVLLYEFRWTLLLASLVLFGGAAVITLFYDGDSRRPGYLEAVYDLMQLLSFQGTLAFPRPLWQKLFFLGMPLLALFVLAESLIRFGVLFFNRKNRMEAWNVALAATTKNHVVVCGMGRVGYRIAEELLEMGEAVVAVERQSEGSFLDSAREKGVVVLTGDARSRKKLEEAGVGRARAVICSSNDDLANIEIALTAREIDPMVRVVIRMFDPGLAEKFTKSFDMETFSTTAISAPVFAAAATDRNIVHSFYLGEKLLSLAQLTVGAQSGLAGRKVSEVEQKFDASVVVVMKGTEVDYRPEPGVVIESGDKIGVLASMQILGRIEKENAA